MTNFKMSRAVILKLLFANYAYIVKASGEHTNLVWGAAEVAGAKIMAASATKLLILYKILIIVVLKCFGNSLKQQVMLGLGLNIDGCVTLLCDLRAIWTKVGEM